MKRNSKNNKVLRAIAVGLAVMITVTAVPATTMAEIVPDTPVFDQTGSDKDKVEIPEEVQNATQELKDAAFAQPSTPSTPDTQSSTPSTPDTQPSTPSTSDNQSSESQPAASDKPASVADGIDKAQEVVKTITLDKEGNQIPVDNLIKGKVKGTDGQGNEISEDVTAKDVSNDLNNAENLLNPDGKKDNNKLTGVYGDIESLQNKINNYYAENLALDKMLNAFTQEADGSLSFADLKNPNVTYNIAGIPVTDANGTQVTDESGKARLQFVLTMNTKKEDGTPSSSSVNLSNSFNRTDDSGDNSKKEGEQAGNAIRFAQNAAGAGSEGEANSNMTKAISAIEEAEKLFSEDSNKLDEAEAAVKQAQDNLAELKKQADKAEKAYNEIKDFVESEDGATKNATALNEQLKAAEKKANSLRDAAVEEQKKLAGSEELLKLLEDIKDASDKVDKEYKEKGKTSTKDGYCDKADELCKLLIEYYIKTGQLTVDGKSLGEGQTLEIGAAFEYSLTYKVPDKDNKTKITTDNNGVPTYGTKDQTDKYDIPIGGKSANEHFNSNTMAFMDDQGFIHANKNDDNRIVVNIKGKDDAGNEIIVATGYFNYRDNDDGSIYIYAREIDDPVVTQHYDAVTGSAEIPEQWSDPVDPTPAQYGYFNGGKEGTDINTLYNEDSGNLDQVFDISMKDDNGEDVVVAKIVPDFGKDALGLIDYGTPSGSETESDGVTTKIEYNPVGDPVVRDYNTDPLAVVNKSGNGANKVINEELGRKGENVGIWNLDGTVRGETKKLVREVDLEAGDIVEVHYHTLLGQDKTFKITKDDSDVDAVFNRNRNWIEFIDDVLAHLLDTANYEITVYRTEDEYNGIVGDVYQTYEKKTTTTTVEESSKSVSSDKNKDYKTSSEAESALNSAIATELSGYSYDASTKTYTKTEGNTVTKATVTKSTSDYEAVVDYYKVLGVKVWPIYETFYKYSYEISFTSTTTETATVTEEKKIATKCFDTIQYARTEKIPYDPGKPAELIAEKKEAVTGTPAYDIMSLKWKTDDDSETKAKEQKLLATNDDGRTVNGIDYKEKLAQIAEAGQKILDYTSLAEKVTAAKEASETLLDMLKNFTYPSEPAATADAQSATADAQTTEKQTKTDYSFDEKSDNYIGKILGGFREKVDTSIKLVEAAKEKRDDLGEEIKKARKIVDNTVLPTFEDETAAAPGGSNLPNANNNNTDDDSDDDDYPTGSGDGGAGYPAATTISGPTLTPVALYSGTTTSATGTAAPATGRGTTTGRNAAVLGARAENPDETEIATTKDGIVVSKVDQPAASDDTKDTAETENKELARLSNNEVPLAATPYEEGLNLNLLWLLAVAVVCASGIYGYERHRRKAAVNEETKKFKKN
ncbi:MAG: hypothetical protein K6E49_03115 [Lachnospiraceae bacterium]|nr:hypothetical protein [Lachnospiraceae bacterium]